MDELELLNQILQGQQPQMSGPLLPGPMRQPQSSVEIQKKTTAPIDPVITQAVGQPARTFPTSLDEFNALMKRTTEGLKEQKKGVQGIEEKIAGLLSSKDDKNITPFLAISDLLSGTQHLKNYKTPKELKKERELQALGFQMQLQKAKGDLTDKEIDLFKAQYQDAFNRERLGQEEDLLKLKLAAESGKTPELKEWQVKDATYGKRLEQAENVFDDLTKKGFDRASMSEGAASLFQRGPLEDFKSSDLKRQEQAERNFLTAILRKESGAAISATEFDTGEKMYFPRLGDTPEVLAQKKANREQAKQGMKLGAGPAWEQIKTVTPTAVKAKEGDKKEWEGKNYELRGDKWVEVK